VVVVVGVLVVVDTRVVVEADTHLPSSAVPKPQYKLEVVVEETEVVVADAQEPSAAVPKPQ